VRLGFISTTLHSRRKTKVTIRAIDPGGANGRIHILGLPLGLLRWTVTEGKRHRSVHDQLSPTLGSSSRVPHGGCIGSLGAPIGEHGKLGGLPIGCALPPEAASAKEQKLKAATFNCLERRLDELHIEKDKPPMAVKNRVIDDNPFFVSPTLERFFNSPNQSQNLQLVALPPSSCGVGKVGDGPG
jgi:hypothetical protein